MSLRLRLEKLEQRTGRGSPNSDIARMTDAELHEELTGYLSDAKDVVVWHANHPHGFDGPAIDALVLADVTLEMIAQSEHVGEFERSTAQLLLGVDSRSMQQMLLDADRFLNSHADLV